MAFNWWNYLGNTTRTYKKKESDTSNNKVYECQTKDDISWQFICVSLLAIPKNWLQTILCRSCIFSFHYPFNFLTRMSNATNSNKYAWQFHFVFCYVFFIYFRVTITTVTITFSCHIGILSQLQCVSQKTISRTKCILIRIIGVVIIWSILFRL